MQQQQPLAFTIIKTVVSARDEGRQLSAAMLTAWELLKNEMSPAHRVISEEVTWGPAYQSDLRFVIEGIREQFIKDPALETEVLTFLAEVEPYADSAEGEAALPLLLTTSVAGSSTLTLLDQDFLSGSLKNAGEQSSETLTTVQEAVASTEEIIAQPAENSYEIDIAKQPEFALEELTGSLADDSLEPALAELPVHEDSTPASTPPVLEASSTYDAQDAGDRNWPLLGASIIGLVVIAAVYFMWPSTYQSSTKKNVDEQQDLESKNSLEASNSMDTVVLPRQSLRPNYQSESAERLAQEVDALLEAGNYESALQKQQLVVGTLSKSRNSVEEIANAQTLLAQLHAGQANYMQAVVEQRKSLDLLYDAAAEPTVEVGRAHLLLASYYAETEELHMSRAHLRQARQIFGQFQELTVPSDIQEAKQVDQLILERS